MKSYILKDGQPVPEPDIIRWSQWYQTTTDRQLCNDVIAEGIRVSTVFLGLDHNWGAGPPVLWEIMVFGGPMNEECDRCSGNREQAEAMHARMVERVRGDEKFVRS